MAVILPRTTPLRHPHQLTTRTLSTQHGTMAVVVRKITGRPLLRQQAEMDGAVPLQLVGLLGEIQGQEWVVVVPHRLGRTALQPTEAGKTAVGSLAMPESCCIIAGEESSSELHYKPAILRNQDLCHCVDLRRDCSRISVSEQ